MQKKVKGSKQSRRFNIPHITKPGMVLICAVAVIAVIFAVKGLTSKKAEPDNTAASADVQQPQKTARPAPDIPPASEQNDLVKIAENAQGGNGKICYLTFDDGPSGAVTVSILETLKNYDAKATFFMMGKMIEANKDLAKRVYDEGHLLANHSYSHDYKALYATADSFSAEIDKTFDLIREVTGEEPFKLIRFPGGSYNAGDHAAEKQQYKVLLKQKGYYYADWNCLNGDAEGGSRTPAQLLERIKTTSGADNIVVLMHDAAAKKSTAEALPSVLEYLKGQGYEFRRLDEIPYYNKEEAAKKSSDSMIL